MAIQYPSNNIHGDPGDRWTNDTSQVWWQLKVDFVNSCGQCIQYANTLARFWPVPFHPGCNCRSIPVTPGQRAEPFLDFREETRNLPESQQSAVMGAANYQLVQKGVVQWEDVVGRSGIKPFWEVVQKHRLSVDTLTKAGVPRIQAERTLARLNSPEQLALQQKHKAIYDQLISLGMTPEQIRDEMTKRLAARFGLVGKPNPPGSPLVVIKPTSPPGGRGGTPGSSPKLAPKPKPAPKTGPSATIPSNIGTGQPDGWFKILDKSKAKVELASSTDQETLDKALHIIFGRKVDMPTLASLAGAPDNATVKVSVDANNKIGLAVEAEQIEKMKREIVKRPHGTIEIHNDIFMLHDSFKGSGLGSHSFILQVQQAVALGVSEITTDAAGDFSDKKYDGYRFWPGMGFEQRLEPPHLERIAQDRDAPASIKKARFISEVFATSKGREWWRINGTDLAQMVFSLDQGSYSLRSLQTKQALFLMRKDLGRK